MKSGKQKRKEIKAKREKVALKRAVRILKLKRRLHRQVPSDALIADKSKLNMGNTYDSPPEYYVDYRFTCIDCGAESIWTARQQKWWYEEIGAFIHTTAVRCSSCRLKIRNRKLAQKRHMKEMARFEPHKNEAFFRKRY